VSQHASLRVLRQQFTQQNSCLHNQQDILNQCSSCSTSSARHLFFFPKAAPLYAYSHTYASGLRMSTRVLQCCRCRRSKPFLAVTLANVVSVVFAGPLAAGIMTLDGRAGLRGWQVCVAIVSSLVFTSMQKH
jgi:hypothetical protein